MLHFCHFCCLLLLSFFSFFHTTAFHRNSRRRRRGRGGGRHIDKYLHASTAQSFHSFAHRFHSFAKKTRALFYSKQMTFKTKRDERREKKRNKEARRRTIDESITRDEASVHTHTFRFNDHIPPVEEKKKKKKTRVPLFLVSFSPSLPPFILSTPLCTHTRGDKGTTIFTTRAPSAALGRFRHRGLAVVAFYFNQRQSNAITSGPMPLPEAPT